MLSKMKRMTRSSRIVRNTTKFNMVVIVGDAAINDYYCGDHDDDDDRHHLQEHGKQNIRSLTRHSKAVNKAIDEPISQAVMPPVSQRQLS